MVVGWDWKVEEPEFGNLEIFLGSLTCENFGVANWKDDPTPTIQNHLEVNVL